MTKEESLELLEAMEAELLIEICRDLNKVQDPENDIDVRLQLMPDGNYFIRTGDPCYDLDHNGFWGSITVLSTDLGREQQENSESLLREAMCMAYDADGITFELLS